MALEKIPTQQELCDMVGEELFNAWNRFTQEIDAIYDMDRIWSDGGKNGLLNISTVAAERHFALCMPIAIDLAS